MWFWSHMRFSTNGKKLIVSEACCKNTYAGMIRFTLKPVKKNPCVFLGSHGTCGWSQIVLILIHLFCFLWFNMYECRIENLIMAAFIKKKYSFIHWIGWHITVFQILAFYFSSTQPALTLIYWWKWEIEGSSAKLNYRIW